jgi:hypothetical protein
MLSDLARVLCLLTLIIILSVVKPNVVLMSVAVPIHRLKQTQKKILKVHSHWRCLRRSRSQNASESSQLCTLGSWGNMTINGGNPRSQGKLS